MGLIRLFIVIWIFGFLVLAASATSSYLFSSERFPERGDRWATRMKLSLLWPIAVMSAAGRARLRSG